MPRLSPPRLHRVEHFKCDQPILFRHSCQHVRPPDAGHAVIRINTDSGTRQKCMAGIPSTRPSQIAYAEKDYRMSACGSFFVYESSRREKGE
jgi:hypothetical protein